MSEFDAQLATNVFFDRDDRAFNNLFAGGGANQLAFGTGGFNAEVSKRSATGTQYFLRNITGYNFNTSAFNLFPSAYDTAFEVEFRHPLLQGSGLQFNRLAGPVSTPGAYNGVVLARLRNDIALADFEAAVRNLLRDVEVSYWQLYFAYRNYDARLAEREAALITWRVVSDQLEAGTADGEAEALARDQYYLTLSQVENALSGGSTTVGGAIGVYISERQLRQLMGVSPNDGRLIRPADEPPTAEVVFDWQDSLDMAVTRRVELRRQKWEIKQREGELLAARNFLMTRLDLTGLYRWRGFGDDLLGNNGLPNGSAFENLFQGDLEGWRFGLQLTTPIGRRRAHAGARHAELRLARERALLRNQEQVVATELSSAFAELDRAYSVTRSNYNRTIAARQRLDAAVAKYRAGEELLQFVINAQSRAFDADSEYYRALTEYNLAVLGIHYSRGTFLDYSGVYLTEGPWSPEGYRSYAKESRRFRRRAMDYCVMRPGRVSQGPYNQTAPRAAVRQDGLEDESEPVEALPPMQPTEDPPVAPEFGADAFLSPESAPISRLIDLPSDP